jgi:uncharacterized membrane protein YfcA
MTDESLRAVALVGLAAGLLGGLFGVGGGLLLVPALVYFLGFDQRLAHGTSLTAILPISAASLAVYWTNDNVDWAAAWWLSVGAVVGAVVGTRLLDVVSKRTLSIAFAGVMLLTAARLVVHTDATGRGVFDTAAALGMIAIGALSGTMAGLLGIGGGVIMVPALVVLLGVPPVVAKGTSVAVIIPTAVVGTWRNVSRGNTDLRVGMVMGLCGMVSAVLGGVVADRMSDDVSNALFALLLVVVAIRQLATLRSDRQDTPARADVAVDDS